MKKGISRWSLPAELSLEECLRRAKDAGFDGLELSFDGEGDLGFQTTAEDARAIRRKADAIGIDLVGVATGYLWDHSLTSGDPSVRGQGIAAVDKMLDIAMWLGVDAILVVPGAVDVFFLPEGEVVPYDVAYDRARDAISASQTKAGPPSYGGRAGLFQHVFASVVLFAFDCPFQHASLFEKALFQRFVLGGFGQ